MGSGTSLFKAVLGFSFEAFVQKGVKTGLLGPFSVLALPDLLWPKTEMWVRCVYVSVCVKDRGKRDYYY